MCVPAGMRARLRFGGMIATALLLTLPNGVGIGWDLLMRPGLHNFQRWYRRWGGSVLSSGGIRVAVRLHEALDPTQPVVFVVNHQVAIDIPILMRTVPLPFGFVAKASVRRIPFLGFFAARTGAVFLNRGHPRRALNDLRRAGERVRSGYSVLFFVEGTRSFAPVLGDLQPGAFRLAVEAQVPLVPITICNSYRLADERTRSAQPGTVDVVIGSPISTRGCARRDIPRLMQIVRDTFRVELAPERARWSATSSSPHWS